MVRKTSYPHEIIGEKVEIVSADNNNYLGIKGVVVDETKFTLVIQQDGKQKKLFKKGLTLNLINKKILLSGTALSKSGEERIKG